MWIVYVVAGAFFFAILGIGYFAVKELESAGGSPAPDAGAPAAAWGDEPSPERPATSDQVVFEIEHRIDAELRDIAHALHAGPQRTAQPFHA